MSTCAGSSSNISFSGCMGKKRGNRWIEKNKEKT